MAKPFILIVEDEEPLTLLLRYNLEAEGYEVEAAARGDEAEVRLRERVPDLLILCLLYTSPSPRDRTRSRMPSSA